MSAAGLAVAIALLVVTPTQAAVLAGPVTNPSNGHSYYLLTSSTWTAAEAEAETLSGHLVTINDAEEQAWVFDMFATFGGEAKVLWIGLTDILDEGSFAWVSGQVSEYRNWEADQPDNARRVEHFVGIWPPGPRHPGLWNDWPDDSETESGWDVKFHAFMHGVVEVDVRSVSATGSRPEGRIYSGPWSWTDCPVEP